MTARGRSVTTVPVVRLLGPPQLERDGRRASVDTRKAIALLAYLAVAERPVARDELAGLLWPESENARARGALRRTLSSLTSALGAGAVVADGDALALDRGALWLDVAEFRRLAKRRDDVASLREAAELYRGDFLAGFALRDSAEFDEWQMNATTALRRELAGVLERLADELASGDVDAAIAYARRWLELDALQEAAHRALMRLHAQKGDRATAVRQYRDCVALLERELGVAPGAETTELYEATHGDGAGGVGDADAASLQILVGDLLTLQGRYRDAERNYERAAALGASIAVVHAKLADLHQRLGDYEGADRLYAEALQALDGAPSAERARLLADRSLNAHRQGVADRAQDFAELALQEAKAGEDGGALAQAHNIAGILASHRGDPDAAREHLERSLACSEERSDAVATAAALNNLAMVLKGSEVESAVRFAQRALDLCTRIGDRHREAAMHSNLADILRIAGRQDEAMVHLRISAAIFAEVGEPDELQPEIWKLVEW